MGWIRRGTDDARVWQAQRPASLILAIAGAVILAVTGMGCSQSTGANNNAAGGNGTGCPTQGVGGDTLAPPCVSQPGGSDSGTTGIPDPEKVSASPKTDSSGIVSQPAPSSSLGIVGPARVSPDLSQSPSSPSVGITGPVDVSASPTLGGGIAGSGSLSPQVTGISPTGGTAVGGTSVTITGSGFSGATTVDFGGVSAALTVNSDTEITATSPPGTGTVDITVITPSGTSATGPADQFTYVS